MFIFNIRKMRFCGVSVTLCIFLSLGKTRLARLQFYACSSCLLPRSYILTFLTSWLLFTNFAWILCHCKPTALSTVEFLVSNDAWNFDEINCSTMFKSIYLAFSLAVVTNWPLENSVWSYTGSSFCLVTIICHFVRSPYCACGLC